jgi:hypothetical protein
MRMPPRPNGMMWAAAQNIGSRESAAGASSGYPCAFGIWTDVMAVAPHGNRVQPRNTSWQRYGVAVCGVGNRAAKLLVDASVM